MMGWNGIPYSINSIVVEKIPQIHIDSNFPYEPVIASVITGVIALVALVITWYEGKKNRQQTLSSVKLTLNLQANLNLANELRELVALLGKKDNMIHFILDKLKGRVNETSISDARENAQYQAGKIPITTKCVEISNLLSEYRTEYNEMVYVFNKIKLLIAYNLDNRDKVISLINAILDYTNGIAEGIKSGNFENVGQLQSDKATAYNELIEATQNTIKCLHVI
ncbi:hypothetical protein AAHD08_003530 [Providencia rettgeri]